MKQAIITIVEGQSEVASVPILLRRILQTLEVYELEVARPFRVKRNRVLQPGEIERAIQQAERSRAGAAAVLVLLDADDDCPAEVGPALLERCAGATRLPVGVVFANREFEAWLLGAVESLRGLRGLRSDAVAPPATEAIRGAKERLTRWMEGNRYVEVDDQPALVEGLDLDLARQRCASFEKLLREVEGLIHRMAPGA